MPGIIYGDRSDKVLKVPPPAPFPSPKYAAHHYPSLLPVKMRNKCIIPRYLAVKWSIQQLASSGPSYGRPNHTRGTTGRTVNRNKILLVVVVVYY